MEKGEKKVIAVTGTPGTGKTTFSKVFSDGLDYRLIDLNELIERDGIYELDSDGTKVVNSQDLQNSFKKHMSGKSGNFVVDGLLSHLLLPAQLEKLVVLRTKPSVLKKRLESRNYHEEKIRENMEAEALGVILQEAVANHGTENVYEIDTTQNSPSETVNLFKKALAGGRSLKPGSIDWLEEFYFGSG